MKRSQRKWLLGLLITAFIIAGFWFYPWFYVGAPIEGRVVDAGTQEPLEGVIVTANWEMARGTLGGTVPVGQLIVMEAVTGQDGRYRFSGWGSKWFPKQRLSRSDAPQLIFFKPGYEYQGKVNPYTWGYLWPWRQSDWHGKTIEMKEFEGSPKEYERHLSLLMTRLRFVTEDCYWKSTPLIILAMGPEQEKLRKAGIITAFYSVGYLPIDEKKCGSPAEFFQDYRP